MSSWRRQTVLRMPGRTVGLGDIDDFRRFESAHEDKMNWAPHHFAPSLCGTEQGTFFDYILRDCWIPHPGGGSRTFCRELTPAEKRKFLPAFRRMFPGFTPEQMDEVHYCDYRWYDGSDAPYIY